MLGGTEIHSDESDPSVGRFYYAIGEDTVIEVAVPTNSDTPEGRDLAAAGNAVHSITFATTDLAGATGFLGERGIGTTAMATGAVHIDLDPGHGLNVLLTDRPLPGDTRS